MAGGGREPTLPAEQLERYAEAVVSSCLHLATGDLLLLRAALEHRELVVALAEAAYRGGARHVQVVYLDDRVEAARVRHVPGELLGHASPRGPVRHPELRRPTTASVRIVGEPDPGVYDDLPAERVREHALAVQRAERPWLRAGLEGRRRGTVVAWPTRAWAALVYPELDDDASRRRLAEDLLAFCRLGPDDPADSWDAHAAVLLERRRALEAERLEALELRGPGTRLDLRLAPGVRWLGGPRVTTAGAPFTPNFPTEESFTSPLAGSVEGTFRCSRPLVRGRLIDGIEGEFRRGRLVRLEAADPSGRDFLAGLLSVDPGARRMGEVALVDRSSRIGRTGRVYYNTLLDENAAAHFAFGAAYTQTRPPETGRRGLNRSAVHLDVMIGTDDFEVTGVRGDGSRVPLLADGTWQLEA